MAQLNASNILTTSFCLITNFISRVLKYHAVAVLDVFSALTGQISV
jgi:hypothetical protein